MRHTNSLYLHTVICALLLFTIPGHAQSSNSTPPASQTPTQAPATQTSPKTDEALALVKQGQALAGQGKFDEAMALYEQAQKISPKLYQAELYMGVTLDLEGKYDEARLHLTRAIALANDTQTTQALRVMAVSYAFQKNTDKAREYEQRAFDLQYNWKKYAEAAATADELARIYLEAGDFDNAFQWYQTGHLTALRTPNLTPAEKDLWEFRWESAMARVSARKGQKEKAQEHLAAAKAILDKGTNPDQMRFYPYIAGYVDLYTGDTNGALKELEKLDQKDPYVLSLEAQAYEKLGDKAKAKSAYEQILTINVHNPGNAFARPLAKEKLASM